MQWVLVVLNVGNVCSIAIQRERGRDEIRGKSTVSDGCCMLTPHYTHSVYTLIYFKGKYDPTVAHWRNSLSKHWGLLTLNCRMHLKCAPREEQSRRSKTGLEQHTTHSQDLWPHSLSLFSAKAPFSPSLPFFLSLSVCVWFCFLLSFSPSLFLLGEFHADMAGSLPTGVIHYKEVQIQSLSCLDKGLRYATCGSEAHLVTGRVWCW